MASPGSSSKRVLKKPTLEYAKYTITYMRISPSLLHCLIAVLTGIGLFAFSLMKISQDAGLMMLLIGAISAVVARWRLQTTFGLYLAGPALACIIGGTAFWAFESVNWLWVPAVLTIGWALWKFVLYSNASVAFEDTKDMGQYSECQITFFFRPFDSRYAEWARNLVIPLLMSYGRVVHVGDNFFKESPTIGVLSLAYRQHVEEVLSRMDEYSEATKKVIEMTKAATGTDMLSGRKFNDSKWKESVLMELKRTDIAVVDISTASENVLWEPKNCFRYSCPLRVVLIASLDASKDIEPLPSGSSGS